MSSFKTSGIELFYPNIFLNHCFVLSLLTKRPFVINGTNSLNIKILLYMSSSDSSVFKSVEINLQPSLIKSIKTNP